MLRVIRQARRRLLVNELFSQAANAVGAALLAIILLLLAGSELLRWQWLLPVPVLAAAAGVFLALRRLPAPYRTAQIVDRRMRLADALSTAWFFSRNESGHATAGMVDGQQEQAGRIAETLDVKQAIPFRLPRRAYAVAVLALVAGSLFALRYGVMRSMDLHPPLARLLEDRLGMEPKETLAQNPRRTPLPGQGEEPGQEMAQQDQKKSAQAGSSDEQDQDDSGDSAEGRQDSKHRGDEQAQNEKAEQQSNSGDRDDSSEQAENASDPSSNQPEPQQGSQGSQGKQSGSQRDSGSNDGSSLLSKMKDALQNLLSRVKPPPGNPGSQQNQEQNGRQQGKDGQSGGKQSSKDSRKGEGNRQNDSQDGQSGDQAGNSTDSKGDSGDKSDGPQTSKQPGNGIGNRDGDKAIKEAEQLAAMGKISEIIGKRSANLTGEATVEVQSTKQQLQTPYAQRGAQHAQGGAEINRDEIPVGLEAYVEKYFEQVQKQAGK